MSSAKKRVLRVCEVTMKLKYMVLLICVVSCALPEREEDSHYGDYGYYPNYYEYMKERKANKENKSYKEDDWLYDYYE